MAQALTILVGYPGSVPSTDAGSELPAPSVGVLTPPSGLLTHLLI